ncbi:MAG: aryl-sulfate sulfotransferase [Cognatishimia sp.]
MIDFNALTDEEAKRRLEENDFRIGTLFRALDKDGDGRLSPEEIDAAPEVLRAMAKNGSGSLTENELGGPTTIPGVIRRSGIVRMLDFDGDLVVTAEDIADAPNRIRMLDRDGDGYVTADDDIPKSGDIEASMPMGTPSQVFQLQHMMNYREPEDFGPLLPRGQAGLQDGYTLIQECCVRSDVQKANGLYLIDNMGRRVHKWHMAYNAPEAISAYLLENGNIVRASCKELPEVAELMFPVGINGTLTIEDADSNILWEFTHFEEEFEALHHDFEVLPNGNILAICWANCTPEKARTFGWRDGSQKSRIVFDKLYELKPNLETGETEIVWEWDVRDHIVQDMDAEGANYGSVADTPNKIDINFAKPDEIQFNEGQLIHLNAISYNPDLDLILLSSPIFGEVWVIDHSTTTQEARTGAGGRYGKGGDLLFRWGNPAAYQSGTAEDQVLFWQHDVQWLLSDVPNHGGHILVYNNGGRRGADGKPDPNEVCQGVVTGAYTDVLEVKLPFDKDGGINSTGEATVQWGFNQDGSKGVYSPFMSSAQRLPNGNLSVLQGYNKRILEATDAGEIILDYYMGGPGRIFKIRKYPPDYPGIQKLAHRFKKS